MNDAEQEPTLPFVGEAGIPPQHAETRGLDSITGKIRVDHAPAVPPSGLHVRCPHCHNPIELLPDAKLETINCTICGSNFSLTDDEDDSTRDARGITQVGHFKLVERLGIGGFGAVWKAHDAELDRTVAIKIPRSGQLDKLHQDLFMREARSAAQLRHPNIVPVYEVGRDGDTLYIVSEFVRGITLSDRITAGPLSAREAVEICTKIAYALHHAHEQGVVHRDLKPANVMLNDNGEPHLMDFGLARREANEITMTVEGQVLGTPAYMSPEQAQGEGHTADRRSDVYSVGVMLFQLLTGELPFRGNSRMLIHQVIHDVPPSPRKLNSTVPRDLETISLRCMEKDPNRRFATAEELADEFLRYLRGEPIVSRPISRVEQAWRWCRRKPLVAALAGTIFLLLTSGLAVTAQLASIANNSAIEATQQRDTAQSWLDGHSLALAGRTIKYQPQRSMIFLDRVNSSRRDFAWDLLARRASSFTCEIKGHKSKVVCITAFPDGDTVGTVSTDRAVRLWSREKKTALQEFSLGCGGQTVSVSPDGQLIAAAGDDPLIRIWIVKTGQLVHSLKTNSSDIISVAFSPNGKTLASGGSDGKIYLWDPVTGDLLKTLNTVSGGYHSQIYSVAFAPNSDKLYVAGDRGMLVELDVQRESIIWEDTISRQAVSDVVMSPNGRLVATIGFDWTIRCFDSTSHMPLWEFDSDEEQPLSLDFSPTSETLATAGCSGAINIRDAETGKILQVLAGHPGATVQSITWTEDGRSILSASNTGTFRESSTNADVHKTEFNFGSSICQARWRLNGKSLVLFCRNGEIYEAGIAGGRKKLGEIERIGSIVDAEIYAADSHCVIAGEEEIAKCQLSPTSISVLSTCDSTNATCVAVSSDGLFIYCGDSRGNLQRLDTATLTKQQTLRDGTYSVIDVTYSPTGEWLASCGLWSRDHEQIGSCFLRSTRTLDKKLVLQGHHNYETCVEFSRDGKFLATAGADRRILLRDLPSGAVIHDMSGHDAKVAKLTFSPDGDLLASLDEAGSVRLWHTATGLEIVEITKDSYAIDLEFSPNGNSLAVVGSDGMLRIWTP